MTIIRFTLLTLHQKEPARKSRGLFLVLLLSAVRTPSAVARQNVRGTMISPTSMRTAADNRRNECAVESRKKNPDRYCDPDSGAGNQSRTDDLVITNDVLYQLSHASKIVVFSVDFTIISNFSPFVNPFLKIFLGWGEEDLGGGGEDLGGREPPLERWGSLPPNLPHSPRTSPTTPPLTKRRFVSIFVVAGSWGKFFISDGR